MAKRKSVASGLVVSDPKGELTPIQLATMLVPKRDGESIYNAAARDILTGMFSVVVLDPFPAVKPKSADL